MQLRLSAGPFFLIRPADWSVLAELAGIQARVRLKLTGIDGFVDVGQHDFGMPSRLIMAGISTR
jgi:hypothetical protein